MPLECLIDGQAAHANGGHGRITGQLLAAAARKIGQQQACRCQGLCKHHGAEFLWEIARSEDIHRDAQQALHFDLDGRNVHQSRFRRGIDQHIQVAAVVILATQDRPENARIAGTMSQHDAVNLGAMVLQGL